MTNTPGPESSAHRRPTSRPGSRPTTPLRRSNSRTSVRQVSDEAFPLNALEPAFAELSDSLGTLEANFGELQVMHDSLSRFNESFASFLYGLNMNAFCVDYPENPVAESFKRVAEKEAATLGRSAGYSKSEFGDAETTYMTNDMSFVAEPKSSAPPSQALKTPARRVPTVRGGGTRGGRGIARGASGIARGRGPSISYR